MPFWNRGRRAAATDWMHPSVWTGWDAPRNYIAGEASYTPALARLTGPVCEEGYLIPVVVTLERERGNPYDHNALRADVSGQCVGYLRRHLAAQLAPALDAARLRAFSVPGILRGGAANAPNVGCHIWLDRCLHPAGMQIELPEDDQAFEVAWPPHEHR